MTMLPLLIFSLKTALLLAVLLLPSTAAGKTKESEASQKAAPKPVNLQKLGRELDKLYNDIDGLYVDKANIDFIAFKKLNESEKRDIVSKLGKEFAKSVEAAKQLLVIHDNKADNETVNNLVQQHDPSHLFAVENGGDQLQCHKTAPFGASAFQNSAVVVRKLKEMVNKLVGDEELQRAMQEKQTELQHVQKEQTELQRVQAEFDEIDQIIRHRNQFRTAVAEADQLFLNAKNLENFYREKLRDEAVEEQLKKLEMTELKKQTQFNRMHHYLALARIGIALHTDMLKAMKKAIILTEEEKAHLAIMREALEFVFKQAQPIPEGTSKDDIVDKTFVALHLKSKNKSLESLAKLLCANVETLMDAYDTNDKCPKASVVDVSQVRHIVGMYCNQRKPMKELERKPLAYLSEAEKTSQHDEHEHSNDRLSEATESSSHHHEHRTHELPAQPPAPKHGDGEKESDDSEGEIRPWKPTDG